MFDTSQSSSTATTVDLWLIATETVGASELAALRECLPSAELAQLDQRRSPQAQQQFLLSRGCLRSLLSRYVAQPPTALTFIYGPLGKPALGAGPQFNLSHSGQRLLIAVSNTATAIGVDIEALRPIKLLEGLCHRCLTPTEATTVLTLPSPEADRRFLRYWTGKEACLKALGQGIADSMLTLELTLDGQPVSANPSAVPVTALNPYNHPGQLYQWEPEPGYLAAVAVQGHSLTTEDSWRFLQATPQELVSSRPGV